MSKVTELAGDETGLFERMQFESKPTLTMLRQLRGGASEFSNARY